MSEKTYDPTPRHREKLREQGDVALSPDLAGSVGLLVAIYYLAANLGKLLDVLQDLMRRAFGSLDRQELTIETLVSGSGAVTLQLLGALLPFFLVIGCVGIALTLAQTRGMITTKRLKPDFSRVNPFSGLKRVFSRRGLFEALKGLIKMVILGLLLYVNLQHVPVQLAQATGAGMGPALALLGDSAAGIARSSAIFLVLVGGLDYVQQFRSYRNRLKMTREEVEEEMKSAEGQPMIRAKIREMQRRWSRRRMMQELISADVVVTNPTHLAIALKYDPKKMSAPTVIAKGKDIVAQQIVNKAREHRIPIVQNIPLARALIHVELGAAVPVELYKAVAEVLAFVYRLRRSGTIISQGATH